MQLASEQFERILRALAGPPVAYEKRRAERFPLTTPVELARPSGLRQWKWTSALTHDISELGLGLITVAPAQRGERMVVKLPDGAGGSMMISCTVAHSRSAADGLFCVGLQFVEVSEAADAPPPRHDGAPARAPRRVAPIGKI